MGGRPFSPTAFAAFLTALAVWLGVIVFALANEDSPAGNRGVAPRAPEIHTPIAPPWRVVPAHLPLMQEGQ